jgi:hypothetical protein
MTASPLATNRSRVSVMQYVVLCLRWEVGSVGSQVIRCGYCGGTGVCLLSSFLLFSTRYVRYLMVFWWMSFMSFLMLDLGIFRSVNFLNQRLISPYTNLNALNHLQSAHPSTYIGNNLHLPSLLSST